MPVRFTVDSNVLVYAADDRDPARQETALEILALAALRDCVLLPQALAEFFHAVSRKGLMPRREAAAQVRDWSIMYAVAAGANIGAVLMAAEAAAAGRFQFFDALLLTTARDAGCAAVISGDMADGAELNGVRVVAAFEPDGTISPRATALLEGA